MRKQRKEGITRNKYRVTIVCIDGSRPQFTIWAESPEHAIQKGLKKAKITALIIGQQAEVEHLD